ncbi:MAG: bifunctional homocysteine S-methyltransferase/methylenetetrahydrofolate reductase [Myxococcales bacterium]|nr:bifunctional homocysteine S-methyltransferase/methylenetetrahydrofolate reductase [Myxococcales bacterium]
MQFDGAMGSLLYGRGVFHTRSYDELSISQPELVRAVHQDYLAAGADILETNTFGANRMALAKHGLANRVVELNVAAAKLAKEVAGDTAYVAGAVGPTGAHYAYANKHGRQDAGDAIAEQIDALGQAGVDIICLETFSSIVELEVAIAECRRRASKLPIIAHLTFGEGQMAKGGLEPEEVAQRLVDAGANIIGANCGAGPDVLYKIASRMVGRGAPVSVQPNAGQPEQLEGRTIYVANPEHFGVYARRLLKSGVQIIGGCCGTTPKHIQAMAGAVRMMGGRPQRPEIRAAVPRKTMPAATSIAQVDPTKRSALANRIAAEEFAVSVELNAPHGLDTSKVMDKIRLLQDGGVDTINVADGPRASARMGNLAFCAKAQLETSAETILHVCCRDRNYLGLVSHLLGAHALGIRNLVIITGDPPKMGDYPFATPVYDVDSIELLTIAAGLNAGIDPAGNEMEQSTSFLLATGAEPAANDYDRELRRLERKQAAGAQLVMTQPAYDSRTLERFLADVKPMGIPVMVGVLPLASHRNAEFLHNEVPGMQVPLEYRERMAKAGAGPSGRAAGIAIAKEALSAVASEVAGVYIMPPFNRAESALEILASIPEHWPGEKSD